MNLNSTKLYDYGRLDEWIGVKPGLGIAYSNKNVYDNNKQHF
jgi:hypothetical protein